MNSDTVQLAWALVAGRLAHISEFRNVPTGLRPSATCEGCGLGLVMKLGLVRAHHYSHRPGSRCPLIAPETARHFNTKHLLASKLRSLDALCVSMKCTFSSPPFGCSTDVTSVVAEAWDTVRVEPFIDPVRPDILLLTRGVAMLAIEIRATHAVADSKATRLSELGIPWIEVAAGAECDEWVPGSQMPVLRYESASAPPRLCSTHSALEQAARSDAASPAAARRQLRNASSYQADLDHHGDRWRFRVVDCYPARARRIRKVFWVYSTRLSPFTLRLRLVDDSTSSIVAEIRTSEKSEEAFKELHRRLIGYLRRLYERFYSPLRWLDSSAFPVNPATVYLTDFMPVKYRRDSKGEWTTSIARTDV
jgi:hypothetical protein